MKQQTLIICLLGFAFALNAQSDYGKGKFRIKFETAIGCPAEIQSDNLKFTEEKLNQIIPLLVNLPSIDKGYFNEFGTFSIFPFGKKGLKKEDYQEFAQNQFDTIKLNTEKLSNLSIPIEFESLRNAHLNNREIKLRFSQALLDWTKDGNEEVLCKKLLKLCKNNPEVSALLETIFNLQEWEEQFLKLSVQMSNLYNKINLESYISAWEIEKQLFIKYGIKCLVDPECKGC